MELNLEYPDISSLTSLGLLNPKDQNDFLQIQQQYLGRHGVRRWGSMSEGGACAGRTNLIVNYLPQSVAEKDLYAMFTSVGPVESCRVMKDFKTGYSYGFGFVNFAREEDAARAIDTFNGYQLRNKRLKVSYARPSGDDIKDTNLYVTNLPRAITEEQLETIFGKYGRIVQKHILRDKNNGTPRGVAFVRYDKREEAQEAIAALNNVIPEGGTEPLSVKPVSRETNLKRATSMSRSRCHTPHFHEPEIMVAEEHGKQKAAYYAGWAAGFHHNRAPSLNHTVLPQRHHSLDQLDMLHSRQDYSTNYGMYSNPTNRYLRRDFYNQSGYTSHHRPF
ncbi:sex-lethal homolog isoform X4 [Plutella xylostella]|uniref:sex-lethal homolog isoform X4 n=1 Tax=Plutella xylostella TaxID=51655 RepID=UPI002032894B|nr:sex-lethal homolog isoform X4 [Plutella xylostella]